MKKILAVLVAAMMLALCVPAGAIGAQDVNPIGRSIADIHAPYITAGGAASTTDFLTIDDFASHTITIINAWDHMCGPCINEMPYFQQVEQELGHDGEVLVVGSCDTMIGGTLAGDYNWLQSHNYTYLNVIPDSVLHNLVYLNGFLPQTFFVNSEGVIVDYIAGGTSYNVLVNKITQWVGHYFPDVNYDVSYVNGVTGEVFEVQSVHAGDTPVYPTPPEMEGYSFQSWSPATPPVISGPTTITANYSIATYRVRFFDSITNQRLSTVYVQHGSSVTPPTPPEHEGYTFVGWDHDLDCITESVDIYTIYQQGAGVPGDLDGDGSVAISDALTVLRIALGLMEGSPAQNAAADFDGDGEVTITDALAVLRRALGLN